MSWPCASLACACVLLSDPCMAHCLGHEDIVKLSLIRAVILHAKHDSASS